MNNQRRRGGESANTFEFEDLFEEDDRDSYHWHVGREWYNSEHFRQQSELFEEWFDNFQSRRNAHITFRGTRNIVMVRFARGRTQYPTRYKDSISEVHVAVDQLRRVQQGRRLKALIGMLAFSSNFGELRETERYNEADDEIGTKRKYQVSNMTATFFSTTPKLIRDKLLAYGQSKKTSKDFGVFSKQFSGSQKSNMPMFECVRLFAELNRCNCTPGRSTSHCRGFLFCPLSYQHPIQTIHDLFCKDKYLCVSLALSIAVYLAHKDAHKLFGLNSKDKTVLLEMSTVRESYDIPLTKQAEYIEAIDNLMSWCDRNKKVRVSEVLVYEGIAKVNFMFEQENLKCHIHLLDLFQETVVILRKIEQQQDIKSDTIKREIGRSVMDLGGVKLDKTKTNMYLVYYLSHVMLLSKDQVVLLLEKFAGDFIKEKLKPFLLMPNVSANSFFGRVSTINPDQLKMIQSSCVIDSNMCVWFDGRKRPTFQVNTQSMNEQDLKSSVAIMSSEQDEQNLQHIYNVRHKHFKSYGLAAFDIETCMETDSEKLQCGNGNQIPYMLSLKGQLYDYKNEQIVNVDVLFTKLENFDQPLDDVCHQFVNFLIEGNYFSPDEGANKNFIFAHNGCKFDFLFVIRWLTLYQQKTAFRMIGNADKLKAIICQGISFYDSFQVISRSLNQMANAFLNRSKNDISIGDIRKGDLKSVEFNTPNIDGKTQLDLIGEYCKLDSELLYLCMDKFFKAQYLMPMHVGQDSDLFYVYNQKTFHMTASSMALSLFTTCFLKYAIGCAPKFLKIERETYGGGYTCNLKSICSFGISVDINSSYAAQMLASMPLTHKNNDKTLALDIDVCGSLEYHYNFNDHDLYHISYDLELDEVSCMIVRSKNKLGLIELQTQQDVWVWGIQLKQMMELLKTQPSYKYIKIHETIQYEDRAIYKEYIQTIYKQRTANADNPVLNALYKMLLCGLYGKHGQRDMKSQQMFTSIQDAIDYVNLAKCYMNQTKDEELKKQNMWLYVVRQANDSKVEDGELKFIESEQPLIYGVEVMEQSQKHIGSLVRMASFICAKARVHLVSSYTQVVEQLAQQMQLSKYEMCQMFQLVYCDTDSLYIDSHKLMARLIEINTSRDFLTDSLKMFIDMSNQNTFTQYARSMSKSEAGLLSLKQLYVEVCEQSQFLRILDGLYVSDPGDSQKKIKFVDPKILGSFKVEKYIVAAAFAAPKQYSVYYFENFDDKKLKNDVKMKGVRSQSRCQNPQLIFEQVDIALHLLQQLQLKGIRDLTTSVIDHSLIKSAIAQLVLNQPDISQKAILSFDGLLQFRGHKTGVTIHKINKYVSFVLNKRKIVVSENSTCIDSIPHKDDSSFEIQRQNLNEITKQLKLHRKLFSNSKAPDGQVQVCSASVKRNNQVLKEVQNIIEENSKQPYWFYDQTLFLNSCISTLDKIQSKTKQSFDYNRQNLPTNLQLIERYIKLVKNRERLNILFRNAYNDFLTVQNSIDEVILIEAFHNDILKGFIDQTTPRDVVVDTYGKLMLLNMCLANKVWRLDQLKNKQTDVLFDQFNDIFARQKSKACWKKSMTESVIYFNLSVIFKVTMFQFTCKLIQMAIDHPQIEMSDQELKYSEIRQAWTYERNNITLKKQLEKQHIDTFLGMNSICSSANMFEILDAESSESE